MNILVTGSTGFIGSYVTKELVSQGHQVVCLVSDASRIERIESISEHLVIVEVDYSEQASWDKLLEEFKIDGTIHLGWSGVAGKDRNENSQIPNIAIACKLAELTSTLGGKFFISTGSQAEYGPVSGKIHEDHPANPTTLYGKCKAATRTLCEHICEEHNLRFAWIRVFSTYGPGDNPWWMLPTLINSLADGVTPELTLGEQKWDFLHVRDAARAITLVAENSKAMGTFNLGSGQCPTLRQTIEKVRDFTAPGAELAFGAVPYRPDQVMHLEADISKLKSVVHWEPEIDLDSGLQETVAWITSSRANT